MAAHQVAAGWRHCLLLTEAGKVFALGDDEFGQTAGAGGQLTELCSLLTDCLKQGGTAAVPLPSAELVVGWTRQQQLWRIPCSLTGVAAGACHSLAWDAAGPLASMMAAFLSAVTWRSL